MKILSGLLLGLFLASLAFGAYSLRGDFSGERLAAELARFGKVVMENLPELARAITGEEAGGDLNGDGGGGGVSRVEIIDGVPVVSLSAETQAQGGIEVEAARPVQHVPVFSGFGRVLDVQPLLELRARHGEARMLSEVARAELAFSKEDSERLRRLKSDVSAKTLQQAEAARKANQAQLDGALSAMKAIRNEARQRWGDKLADLALGGKPALFEPFLAGEEALLLVTLPAARELPQGTRFAEVFRNGGRENPIRAAYISPAPRADPVVQGETYFFRAPAERLRQGMTVDVRITAAAGVLTGVIVPHEAVAWYSGRAWVYVQIDDEHFVRRAIQDMIERPDGWFVGDSLEPGERMVVTGAQMLLSEEFRWQIVGDDIDD